MKEIHWFKGKEDCENFFSKIAKNCREELKPDFVFEGNSGQKYSQILQISDVVGFSGIGISKQDYENDEVDFIDTLFVNMKKGLKNNNFFRMNADDVSFDSDGIVMFWWD